LEGITAIIGPFGAAGQETHVKHAINFIEYGHFDGVGVDLAAAEG
jgi:hypothetical protein